MTPPCVQVPVRSRSTRSLVTIGAAVALAVPLGFVGPPAPTAADCGGDGIQWPSSAADVRGITITGTVIAVLPDVPEPGAASIRIAVDEVFDGAVADELILTPWCVATRFVPGERYLVSTRDALPLPGSLPTTDEYAWFTDGASVAWRLQHDDRVTLLGYGDGSLREAPAWLRRLSTVRAVVRAILPSGGDPDPLRPSAAPSATDPPGVTREALGTTWPEEPPGTRIEMARMTLEPDTFLPPTRYSGQWLARVEAGTLTVTLRDGRAWIHGTEGIEESEDEPIAAEQTRMLVEGKQLSFGPDAVLTLGNDGAVPVSVLTTALPDGDAVSTMVVDPDASSVPAAVSPVVRRIVLTGPGMVGDRYRITVRDRSGRVIGARVPTDRELRFASGGTSPRDYRDIGIGPVAHLEDNVRELLIKWGGTPCGPIATVDVGPRVGAIRVIDRTGGCDAARVGHALVLKIRGDVPHPEDIEGSWERRR